MLKDLTKGNPLKVLLFFALPMFLSMIFQQMYNLADSIVAGNYGGVSSLGAISASTPVVNIFLAISIGGTLGCSVVISTLFGARDYLRMKTAVYTAIISLTIVAFICTLVGIFICRPLLEMLNTPSSLMDDATIYLEIYIFGFFFLFIYNIANSIFTGLGDSKTPLILLIISSVSNIFIDILFANIFKNVVEGVAWATFITQGIASIVSMGLLIIRIRNFKVEGKYPFFNKKILKDMIRIAIPSIIQQSIVSVGQLMVQSLINSYGVETIDGYATAIKINSMAIMSINTLSSSMSSYTAQNMGVKAYDRIKKGYYSMVGLSLVLMSVIVAIVLLFNKEIINLFLQAKEGENLNKVIDVGKQFLITVAPFYLTVTVKIISDGTLRGAGKITPFMISTFVDLIVRVAFSYIFNNSLGFSAICWSFPVGWIVSAIIALTFYIIWQKKNISNKSIKML